eukprot:93307-Chlamydomonas_euryale.AAC.10
MPPLLLYMLQHAAGGKMYARPTLGEHRHRAPQAAAPKQAAKTKRPVILPYEPYFGFLCLEPWYINRCGVRARQTRACSLYDCLL